MRNTVGILRSSFATFGDVLCHAVVLVQHTQLELYLKILTPTHTSASSVQAVIASHVHISYFLDMHAKGNQDTRVSHDTVNSNYIPGLMGAAS